MSISTQHMDQPLDSEGKQQGVASFRLVLKNRHFLLLWFAQLISQIVLNAVNFAVIVLVNDVTHSVFMAGLAITAFTLPAVPFSAIAGVFVDRISKRRVLWVTNVLRVLTMLLMFASLLYDRTSLVPLFALCFLTSLISQFFVPAEGAAIPLLVGERELMPALSLFSISLTVAQGIGFLLVGRVVTAIFPPFDLPVGSFDLHVHSSDMLFLVAAVLYALCAVLIFCIPTKAMEEKHLYEHKQSSSLAALREGVHVLWQDMLAGWSIIRSDSFLLYAVIQLSVVSILMLLIAELAGAFVEQFLHRSSQDLSVVLAPAAIGLIAASVLMPRISAYVGKLRLTILGFALLGLCFFLLPILQWLAFYFDPVEGMQAPWLFWITLTLVFLLGVGMSAVNIPTSTIMQERAPESGRGRVLALQAMFYNAGSIPILLFAGALAGWIGFSQLIVLIAAIMFIIACWASWYLKRHGDIEQAPATIMQQEFEQKQNE